MMTTGFFARRDVRGVVYALLATIVWAGNFVVGRGLAQEVPPVTLAALRWGVAFCAVLPLALPSLLREWPHVRANFRYYLLTALVGVSLFNTLIYIAGRTVPALNLSLTAITAPLFVLVLARIFLGEAITPQRLAGIGIVLCGLLLLISRGDAAALAALHFRAGDGIALGAAFSFAAYTLLVRKKPVGGNALTFLAVTFGLGEIFLLPVAAWELSGAPPIRWSPVIIASVAYLGLGTSLFAFWCWGQAIEYIGATRASLIYYSLPLFCGIEAVLFLGEPVSWVHYVGGALILGGVITATRERRRSP